METTALVLSIISLVTSTISPIIIAGSYFIRHIRHSQCFGSSIDLKDDPDEPLITPENPRKTAQKHSYSSYIPW